MKTRNVAVTGLMLVALSACRVGGWSTSQKATPYGGRAHVTTPDTALAGELLTVDASGVLLAAPDELVRVRWASISRVRVRDRGVDVALLRAAPSEAQMEDLRLVSRYPFGLTEDQLRTLLSSQGQVSVREVR